ncbi:MAG: hypothetical protein ABI461_12625, partial [Polyangiaceae bacterium]
CWNFGILRVWAASGKPMVPIFAIASNVAAAAFALLAVRAAMARTIVRFDARELTVLAPLAPWNNTRIDLAEIERFEPSVHEDTGHTDLLVRLKSGSAEALPIDWQPIPVALRGRKKRLFVAEAADATWLAAALNDMLAAARQLGHDTYRS